MFSREVFIVKFSNIIILILALILLVGCQAPETKEEASIIKESKTELPVKDIEVLDEPVDEVEETNKLEEVKESEEIIKQITFDDFNEGKIEEDIYMVVFSLKTCKPCKAYKETIKEILKEYPDAPIYEIKIENEPGIEEKIDIPGLPMTIITKDGEEVFRETGTLPGILIMDYLELK